MRKRLATILMIVSPFVVLPVAAAYVQWGVVGLPALPPGPALTPETAAGPYGFPAWLRITHYVNFLFLVLLIRSGLQILMDHPRLYWNVHCTPNTEWVRFTPIEVPTDRVWNAKDDARPLSPWIGLPGYRHTHRHGPALALPQRLVLGRQRRRLRGPAVRHRASGNAWCRPPGGSCPTPGPSSSTTPPSTCRRSRTASTATTRSSSWRTSRRCSSWPPWRS